MVLNLKISTSCANIVEECILLNNIDNGILIDIIIDIKMKVRQILSIHNLTLPIVSRAALPLPLPNDNDNTSLAQTFPRMLNQLMVGY